MRASESFRHLFSASIRRHAQLFAVLGGTIYLVVGISCCTLTICDFYCKFYEII